MMETYPKTLKRRLYAIGGCGAALLALIVLGVFHPTAGSSDTARGFMAGFNVGLAIVVVGLMALDIRKYAAALKDADKRRTLYIAEHDERLGYIRTRMGGTPLQIVLYGLLTGTIVAGFFSETVYFALLGMLLFAMLVKGAMKVYLLRKTS